MLRLRVDDDGAGGWALTVPEAGSVQAAECLHTVEALDEEALVAARSRLNPAAGVMLSALWVASKRQLVLIVHHLAVDGVSWRILLEDLNIAWAQHHGGQPIALPVGGTSFARWSALLAEHARAPEVVAQADAWRQVAATPVALPAVQPGGGHVRDGRELVGVTGCRDHPDAVGARAGGVSCRGARDFVDRVRVGVRGVVGQPLGPRSVLMWRATAGMRSWPPGWI